LNQTHILPLPAKISTMGLMSRFKKLLEDSDDESSSRGVAQQSTPKQGAVRASNVQANDEDDVDDSNPQNQENDDEDDNQNENQTPRARNDYDNGDDDDEQQQANTREEYDDDDDDNEQGQTADNDGDEEEEQAVDNDNDDQDDDNQERRNLTGDDEEDDQGDNDQQGEDEDDDDDNNDQGGVDDEDGNEDDQDVTEKKGIHHGSKVQTTKNRSNTKQPTQVINIVVNQDKPRSEDADHEALIQAGTIFLKQMFATQTSQYSGHQGPPLTHHDVEHHVQASKVISSIVG
jgi:hypothetical protein